MGLGFQIRKVTAADRAAIEVLFERHLAELGLVPDARLDGDVARFPEVYGQEGCALLVAVDRGGEVLGMGGVIEGEIRRVHVRSGERRRGVGRRLVAALVAESWRSEVMVVRAVVARRNEPSLRLFQSCGFVRTGRSADEVQCEGYEVVELRLAPP